MRPRLRLPILALALAVLVTLAGCGEEASKPAAKKAKKATTTTIAPAGPTGCRRVAAPKPPGPQKLSRPTAQLDPKKPWRAVVTTNCGQFTITLDVKQSPKTAASFAFLARRGFYEHLTFHRIVPQFVIQGGDPQGDGQGGPGYAVVEPPPRDVRYTRDIVAMAKTATDAPGTSGSQFYVVTGEDAQLPPEYAVLGKVTQGDDVVQRLGLQPTDPSSERPVDPVVIDSVRISSS